VGRIFSLYPLPSTLRPPPSIWGVTWNGDLPVCPPPAGNTLNNQAMTARKKARKKARKRSRKRAAAPLIVVTICCVVAARLMMNRHERPAEPARRATSDAPSTFTPQGRATYYNGVEGLRGDALKQKLHGFVRRQRVFEYGDLWNLLSHTDEDPENPNNVILLYTGWSRPKPNRGGRDNQWNREHTWAKFRGQFGNHPGPGTDLHHIRPTDVSVNRVRGHLDFDNGGRLYSDPDGATACRFDRDSWEPRAAVKGDVARMLFYMAVRYEGGRGDPDLELVERTDNRSRRPQHGRLSALLSWHATDPVDDRERRRNDRIFEKQGNRNPFIDHPELAQKIWAVRRR